MSTSKLTVGDFGDEVARLQEKLKARGFEVSTEEVKRKFYGPATRDAVRERQKSHKIEVTGILDPKTVAALGETKPEKILETVPTVSPATTEVASPSPAVPEARMAPTAASSAAFAPQSRTSGGSIISPIQPLAQGQAVADLQRGLVLLQFELAESEAKARRFGHTTRAAVKAFQSQQGLPVTGDMDDTTAKRLNDVLTTRNFFPPKQRPFQDRQFLTLKPREDDRLDEEARNFVTQRLNHELAEAILSEFRQPSEALGTAIRDMDLDYTKLTDQSLRAVLTDRVLPALLDHPELERELVRHADRGFSVSDETVAARLMLNQELRHNPLFREEVRRSRNDALGKIAKLDTRQIEAIEDLDLDAIGRETWDRLVIEGLLDERKRTDLRNIVEFAKLSDDNFDVIEALRAERRHSPRDLIALDKEAWKELLNRHHITPPEGDSLETYAALLDQNVQRTFPTPYMMDRLVVGPRNEVLERTVDLDPLLGRNEVIFVNGGINNEMDWGTIREDERHRLEIWLRELNRFANTYRHLGIADILNNRTLSSQLETTRHPGQAGRLANLSTEQS